MANEIVVRVSGEDDLSGVASKATSNVASDLDKLANDVASSSKKMQDEGGKAFDGLRDGADNSERRIVGFRDSLTGTSDVITGFKNGDLVTLSTGFADLASSVANLGADVLEMGKKAASGIKTFVTSQGAATAAKVKDIAVTAAHKAATIASTIATQAQTAAQWLLNAAMSANPILLVVLAIAALVAIFIVAWKNSETFRDIVTGAFNTVKDAVMGVFNWVKDNWPLLLAILTGPIGLAVLAIVKNWDDIKAGFTAVKDWIGTKVDEIVGFITAVPGRIGDVASTAFDPVKDAMTEAKDWVDDRLDDIVSSVTGMPDKIATAAVGMWDGIKEAFRSAVNFIVDGWNSLEFKIPGFDPPGPGPSFGGFTLGVPDLPRLGRGGITTGPMMAVIGDNPSGREAVIPLDDPRAGGLLGAGGVHLHFHGPVYGMHDFDRVVTDAVVRASNRRGFLDIQARP